ncbi:MAG: T9SS type A sorting domain-containing protein [Crocinitomicaceae bacterium]|nr:T9SS type A sorting domain-containing protein [Crocinitomicaceae bacterium]MBP6031943.1 T9SS type A sorting domain-containing protein [Crocinitomicaceae bacterium]
MKSLIFSLFTFSCTFSFSQLGNTMYGLARTTNPAAVYIATMDPVTGIATNIGQTSVSSSINLTGAALNPYNNRFCFFGDNGLKSVDLSTGQVTNTATINNPNGTGYFDLFRFNTSDSLMYGLSRRNITNPQTGQVSGAMYLATINEITGTITEISPSSIGQSFAYSGSAIDPHQMVFYYSNGSQLVGLDMYTGGIFSNPTLTFPNGGQNFDNFTYSCSDTTMYGLVRSNYYTPVYNPVTGITTQVFDSAAVHLGKVNAMTGEVTKIGTQSIGVSSFSVNGSSTIDPVNLIYYFISGSGTGLTIYGVSLQTGLVVSQGTISNTGALYFDMMRIQSDCYESYPTRFNPSVNIEETVTNTQNVNVYPNPFSNQITVSSETGLQKIELFHANGQVIENTSVSGKEFTLETSQLMNGVYFLQVTNLEGMEIIKIIK